MDSSLGLSSAGYRCYFVSLNTNYHDAGRYTFDHMEYGSKIRIGREPGPGAVVAEYYLFFLSFLEGSCSCAAFETPYVHFSLSITRLQSEQRLIGRENTVL